MGLRKIMSVILRLVSDAALTPIPHSPVVTGEVVAPLATASDRLAALTDTWLRVRRSERTRIAYRRDLQAWLGHCARAGVDPLNARAADVDGWIVAQRTHGAHGSATARPAAESSIARRVSAVSSWYHYLIAGTADDPLPLVTRNPASRASRPRLDPDYSPTVGLTDAEMDRLLTAADDDSATSSALIRLEFTVGLRVGSTLTARVQDLGWDQGHRTLDIAVKGGTTKRVPLPPVVADAIAEMLAERSDPTGPLFLTPSGTPIYHMYVYRLVRRLARKAALPTAERITPHALRHAAITLYLQQTNGNVRGAQVFAGHTRPETTMRYDRARRGLSDHGAYVLASRFGTRTRLGDDSG